MLDKTGLINVISDFICNLLILIGISNDFLQELSVGCLKGILEITNGIKILSNLNINFNILLPIVATILGFGGISVHMQVASIISNTDLSLKPYLLGKTLHGFFSGIITYIVLNYTDLIKLDVIETFSDMTAKNIVMNDMHDFIGSGNLVIVGLGIVIILTLIRILFSIFSKKEPFPKKRLFSNKIR